MCRGFVPFLNLVSTAEEMSALTTLLLEVTTTSAAEG